MGSRLVLLVLSQLCPYEWRCSGITHHIAVNTVNLHRDLQLSLLYVTLWGQIQFYLLR